MATSTSSPEWDWVLPQGSDGAPWCLGLIGCLTFARGVSERAMLEAFEMDPDSAVPMTAGDVQDAMMTALTDDGPFWVRVAEVDGWGIGIEADELKGYLDNIAARASAGTESVVVSVVSVKGFGDVNYFRDRQWMTAFGIGGQYGSRAGASPRFFDDALADVGLGGLAGIDDDSLAHPPPLEWQIVGVLQMLTNTLGIRLDRDTYAGPLLTASRPGRYFYELPAQTKPMS